MTATTLMSPLHCLSRCLQASHTPVIRGILQTPERMAETIMDGYIKIDQQISEFFIKSQIYYVFIVN